MNNEDDRQSAVLRCLEAGYSVDPTKPFSGRLYKSALKTTQIDRVRYEKSDRRRNEMRERIDPHRRYAPICDNPARAAEAREQYMRMHIAINNLPERQRTIIRECDLKTVSVKEYAAKVGGTESTIRSLRHRGLRVLRVQLAG
jgi:RNA polymerase sigma factor (sigma-70 family)